MGEVWYGGTEDFPKIEVVINVKALCRDSVPLQYYTISQF